MNTQIESKGNLRADILEQMKRQRLNRAQVAKAIEVARSAFSGWLDEKYLGNNQRLEDKLRKWLSLQPQFGGGYCATESSELVLDTLTLAQEAQDMVLIYGGPGVGKTTAIRHYLKAHSETTWLATMSPAASGLVSALETVAEALHLKSTRGGAKRLSSKIQEHLSEHAGSLLVIDEAQHLSMAAIEQLRSIHDAVNIGLAFAGNEEAYARLTGGPRTTGFVQISSRLGSQLFLARPTKEDVDIICASWRVGDKSGIEQLYRLANRPGALRIVEKVIRLIVRGGENVTGRSVLTACEILGVDL